MSISLPRERADTVVVIDFETSGLSPALGDRAIEVGAVLIELGEITRRFQSLMNPGFRINSFIEAYTGIDNEMLQAAPPCSDVMEEFAAFLGSHNLVAHNASFDRRFMEAEFGRIGRAYVGTFACSMLLARRVYPDAPNHRLGSLMVYDNIPHEGTFHRALADSEMTASLWMKMLEHLSHRYSIDTASFALTQRITRTPKKSVHNLFSQTCKDHFTTRQNHANG